MIGWQLSIWNCCKPFFSLLYICHLLSFWRLALSIAVQFFPRHFFSKYCFSKHVYHKLLMPKCMPYQSEAYIFFLIFLNVMQIGRPRRRWEDNIRMDLQEVGLGYEDWIGLAQDSDRWRALVSAVRNLRVP